MKNIMVRTHTFTMLTSRLVAMVLFAALLSVAPFHAALAQTAPSLDSAADFVVLGASTVTNTGLTTVTGDLGLSPGTSVTGFQAVDGGLGIVNGDIFIYPAQKAIDAQSDAALAYAALVAATCTTNLTGQDLGTLPTLTPGVYCFSSSAQLTGTLVLDAQNNFNAVFIFQIGSTLTTASNSSVVVINAGQNCNGFNVFWQVGTSATLGTGTAFVGNILADQSITLNTGASVAGRVFALKAAVTMDTNTVSVCGSLVPPPIDEDYCKHYCKDCCKDYDKDYCKDHDKDYWKDYWKGQYHCKDHEKDYCKDHYCTDHDKDRCKYHDKDNDKNKDKDKNHK
jgi:type VI secretion system secreted protein VgrG